MSISVNALSGASSPVDEYVIVLDPLSEQPYQLKAMTIPIVILIIVEESVVMFVNRDQVRDERPETRSSDAQGPGLPMMRLGTFAPPVRHSPGPQDHAIVTRTVIA
jgi:hypothetical protein